MSTEVHAHRNTPLRVPVQGTGGRVILLAVEDHDPATVRHSHLVVELARRVAHRLDLSPGQIAEVEQVALLHDVGKLSIPHFILNKPGPLAENEWAVMRSHTTIGADAVAEAAELAHLAPAVRACHERWDGRGYPDGLAGEEIPLASRVTFVCDAYDAMTSDRPYRPARSKIVALSELRHGVGGQFCPRCATALLDELLAGWLG